MSQENTQQTDAGQRESIPPAISQATIVGLPQPETWDDFERGCIATFHGGHRTLENIEAFQHGMTTVFNLLRREFPPAQLCKAAPELLEGCKEALCKSPSWAMIAAAIRTAEGRLS